MGKIFLVIIIFFASATALARPWVGISSYYLLAILGPQYIWWWNFEGVRVSLIVGAVTLLGVLNQFLKHNYDLKFLLNRQSSWLALLWLSIACSYFTGPYVDSFAASGLRPDQLFSITNIFFLFYFFAALEMNEVRKLRYIVIIFIVSTIYLTYWANNQYFTHNWNQFNFGRLMGPSSIDGGSIYRDENAFAMLFVTGLPFIYYFGWELKKKWQRLLLWSIIPFSCHAIFLTGSRGGLLGIVSAIICIMLYSHRKALVVPLLLVFIVFYQWQGGDVMKTRSDTIVNYEGESSAEQRIAAWKGGMKMIEDHPITGVGLGSFVTALPHYYDTEPRVAHNTLIQFAAESGVGAGVAYFMVVFLFFVNSRRIRTWCREHEGTEESRTIGLYNSASTSSFAGLVVCSLFLSLNTYEIFFVLLIFNNALLHIGMRLNNNVPMHSPEQ